jgi:hypothetical protein
MRVAGSTPLPGSTDEYAGLLPDPGRARLFAYQIARSALHAADLSAGRLASSVQLDETPAGPSASDQDGTLAASPDGSLLYAVAPGGGISVVRTDALQAASRLAADKQFRSVGASTDGRLLYVVEQNGAYAVLRADNGHQQLRRPNAGAEALIQTNAGE